jgi:hypothetical protein
MSWASSIIRTWLYPERLELLRIRSTCRAFPFLPAGLSAVNTALPIFWYNHLL